MKLLAEAGEGPLLLPPPPISRFEEEQKYVPAICIHEPLEPDGGTGWYIFAVVNKGIVVRVCKHCRLLYADLQFPTEPPTGNN